MGALDAFDEAFEPETAEVVGGLAAGVVGVEEVGHVIAQGTVGQATGDVFEGGDGGEQRHDPRFAEAQARGALSTVDGGQDDGLEGGDVGEARRSFAERGEEAVVDLLAGPAQSPPVFGVERLAQLEVGGVVDGGLDAQRLSLLEVGLGAGGLVADLDPRPRTRRDDLGAERSRRLVVAPQLEAPVEHDADLVGAAEVDVVADGGLEPGSAGGGPVEHRGVGDLDLAHRERPAVAGAMVGGCERAGQVGQPPVDEGAQVAGAEPGADLLGGDGVLDFPQAVVELGKADVDRG